MPESAGEKMRGAHDIIIAMPKSEYAERHGAHDDSLKSAGLLQSYYAKCNKCKAASAIMLCTYDVDPTTPPTGQRGRCNHCTMKDINCGSQQFSFRHATYLSLPPIAQGNSDNDKRDNSFIEISDEESVNGELASHSSARDGTGRKRRRSGPSDKRSGSPQLAKGKKRRLTTTSAAASDIPLPAREEVFKILDDITAGVSRIKNIMNYYANGD